MNTKNLWLKLACVGLLVGLCIWSLIFKGLKGGIDIQGGHSLTYEIRPDKARIDRLEAKKLELAQTIATEQDEEKREEAEYELEQVDEALKAAATETKSGDLPLRMINLLKDRVDKDGLRSLEWRPLGRDRFEVRMPAAKPETRKLRDDYFKALDALDDNNIQRSEIRSVLQAHPDDREAKIKLYTQTDPIQAVVFANLAAAHDQVAAARVVKDSAQAAFVAAMKASAAKDKLDMLDASVKTAKAFLEGALTDYEDKRQILLKGNISREALHQTFEGYYLSTLRDTGSAKDDVDRNFSGSLIVEAPIGVEETVQASLDQFKADHTARADEIDDVLAKFTAWSEVRERLDDPADLKRLIAKAGVLEFRIAPTRPRTGGALDITNAQLKEYMELLKTPEGRESMRRRNEKMLWFPIRGDKKQRYILLYDQPEYHMLHEQGGSWKLDRAKQDRDQSGMPAVGFELDDAGARRMAKLTSAHQGNNMAILLDGEVYSAPTIQSTISSRGIITGRFSQLELEDLISTLNSGSLPGKLSDEPISQSTFAPSIGKVNRDMGKNAAIWAMIAVAVFMMSYYLLPGFIADLAMLLNIIFVLGTMSLIGAVFTLPGIAGIILTIGIAVDANVLIFERLREEQAKGQTIRQALKNAYDRAFSAIFDANITTMLVCLILGWVGTQEIRGFAITLGLGVVFSLFSSLVFTRWMFQILLDLKLLTKPVFMFRIIGVPKVNWMAKRHFFWVLTIAFMAIGIGSLIMQGGDIWGIEFSSGTKAVITLKSDAMIGDKLPDDSLVRKMFKDTASELGDAKELEKTQLSKIGEDGKLEKGRLDKLEKEKREYYKLRDTAIVETRLDPTRVTDFIRAYDNPDDPDGTVSLDEWKLAEMNEKFFARIDTDSDGILSRDELEENLPDTSYQIATTVTDVEKIRNVAREAFRTNLQIRTKRKFETAAGVKSEQLGLDIPESGWVVITSETRSQVAGEYRNQFVDLEDSILRVLTNVEPPISETELSQRIREMRLQPDFMDHMLTRTKVFGLGVPSDEGYSEFALVLLPGDEAMAAQPQAMAKWLDGEAQLVEVALGREKAMVTTNFDPAIAGEAAQLAIIAVVLSWAAIVVYLWLRFGSVQWGLAAVICLIHDVVIVIGLVAASGWLYNTFGGKMLGIQSFKIDLAMIAAILTVIGYSVNDTIVIFDRIRENRGKLNTVSVSVINASINQTLARTLLTSGTTFIVVIIMYVIGGPGIHAFNYALLAGIVFGTYSSVAVASPLLMGFKQALVAKVTANVSE